MTRPAPTDVGGCLIALAQAVAIVVVAVVLVALAVNLFRWLT